jgi:hypothetical protein
MEFIPRFSASPNIFYRSQKTKKNYGRHPLLGEVRVRGGSRENAEDIIFMGTPLIERKHNKVESIEELLAFFTHDR